MHLKLILLMNTLPKLSFYIFLFLAYVFLLGPRNMKNHASNYFWSENRTRPHQSMTNWSFPQRNFSISSFFGKGWTQTNFPELIFSFSMVWHHYFSVPLFVLWNLLKNFLSALFNCRVHRKLPCICRLCVKYSYSMFLYTALSFYHF